MIGAQRSKGGDQKSGRLDPGRIGSSHKARGTLEAWWAKSGVSSKGCEVMPQGLVEGVLVGESRWVLTLS